MRDIVVSPRESGSGKIMERSLKFPPYPLHLKGQWWKLKNWESRKYRNKHLANLKEKLGMCKKLFIAI